MTKTYFFFVFFYLSIILFIRYTSSNIHLCWRCFDDKFDCVHSASRYNIPKVNKVCLHSKKSKQTAVCTVHSFKCVGILCYCPILWEITNDGDFVKMFGDFLLFKKVEINSKQYF